MADRNDRPDHGLGHGLESARAVPARSLQRRSVAPRPVLCLCPRPDHAGVRHSRVARWALVAVNGSIRGRFVWLGALAFVTYMTELTIESIYRFREISGSRRSRADFHPRTVWRF